MRVQFNFYANQLPVSGTYGHILVSQGEPGGCPSLVWSFYMLRVNDTDSSLALYLCTTPLHTLQCSLSVKARVPYLLSWVYYDAAVGNGTMTLTNTDTDTIQQCPPIPYTGPLNVATYPTIRVNNITSSIGSPVVLLNGTVTNVYVQGVKIV